MQQKTVIIDSPGGIGHGTTVVDAETGAKITGVRHIDISIDVHEPTKAQIEVIIPILRVRAEANIFYEIPSEMADDVFFVNGRPHKLVLMEQLEEQEA